MRTSIVPAAPKASALIQIYMLAPLIKLFIALGVFLILTVPGFFIIQQQSFQQLKELTQKQQQLDQEVSKEAKNYGALLYLAQQTDLAKKNADKILKTLPPESKIHVLLADITKLGTTQGVKFVYFKPQQPIVHEYYMMFPVQVSITGTFHQIGLFLSGLANLQDSLTAVNEFDLHRVAVGQKTLNLQFVVTLYYAKKEDKDNTDKKS